MAEAAEAQRGPEPGRRPEGGAPHPRSRRPRLHGRLVPDLSRRDRRAAAQARGGRAPVERGDGDAAGARRRWSSARADETGGEGDARRPLEKIDIGVSDAGRPSAIDVGGTKIAAVADRRRGRDRRRAPCVRRRPTTCEATPRDRWSRPRERHRTTEWPRSASARPGWSTPPGVLRSRPNLAWRDAPIARRRSASVGCRVTVDNDARPPPGRRVARRGPRGRRVLFVGVGTGIGGGIVIGGRLVRGAHGFAAEIGHVIVEPDGALCGCGNHGCWETVASGPAITRAGPRARRHAPGLAARSPAAIPARHGRDRDAGGAGGDAVASGSSPRSAAGWVRGSRGS